MQRKKATNHKRKKCKDMMGIVSKNKGKIYVSN